MSEIENNIIPMRPYSELAAEKIQQELEKFSGGQKEKAVSTFVASTLTHFCKENERFAEIVYKTKRSLSDCCYEIMKGTGNSISDIDVYRGAVRHYFPNSDIKFNMEITINGEAPSEEELAREVKKPKPKAQKKAKESDEDEDIEDDEEIKEAPAPMEQQTNKKAESKAKPQKKQKKEVLQISLFESMFEEGK